MPNKLLRMFKLQRKDKQKVQLGYLISWQQKMKKTNYARA